MARQGATGCWGLPGWGCGGRATCDVLPYIGTGDGLIAFGALDLIGEYGRVVFSDVSQDLLDHSRTLADDMGVLDRCEFVLASTDDPTDDLCAIKDDSVDVVTFSAYNRSCRSCIGRRCASNALATTSFLFS